MKSFTTWKYDIGDMVLMVTKSEAMSILVDIYDAGSFEKEIRKMYNEFKGLLNEDALASLLVAKHDRYIPKEYAISELYDMKSKFIVSVSGRITHTDNEKKGIIDDGTGKVKFIISEDANPGIKIKTGIVVKLNRIEWHPRGKYVLLTKLSNAEISHGTVTVKNDTMTKFELNNSPYMDIEGIVVARSGTKSFIRKSTGMTAYYTIMYVQDTVNRVAKVMLWDFKYEAIANFREGTRVLIKNLKQKKEMEGEVFVFYSTDMTYIENAGDDDGNGDGET